jgi:hypothetical protein
VTTRTIYRPMAKVDVLSWIERVRHQNIARREGGCMSCTNRPQLMRTTVPAPADAGKNAPPEWVAIYWCKECHKPAYGSASFCRDRKLDFSKLEEVPAVKVQQELF